MDTETASNEQRPYIQIDDLVRELTDEEYSEWLERPQTPPLFQLTPETSETPQESIQD